MDLFNKAKDFAQSSEGQTMMNSQQGKDLMSQFSGAGGGGNNS